MENGAVHLQLRRPEVQPARPVRAPAPVKQVDSEPVRKQSDSPNTKASSRPLRPKFSDDGKVLLPVLRLYDPTGKTQKTYYSPSLDNNRAIVPPKTSMPFATLADYTKPSGNTLTDILNAAKASSGSKSKPPDAFCRSCSERSYRDESGDAGVSFKAGGHISASASASLVTSHEREHVGEAEQRARENNNTVISHVRLFTSECPECHKVYVSGGVTQTSELSNNNQSFGEDLLGTLLDQSM